MEILGILVIGYIIYLIIWLDSNSSKTNEQYDNKVVAKTNSLKNYKANARSPKVKAYYIKKEKANLRARRELNGSKNEH